MTPHTEKYERIAQQLGIDALKSLVPFSAERIRDALAAGDEHLNTLSLASWDKQHGYATAKAERCACCKQWKPTPKASGVWALYVAAVAENRTRRAKGESVPPLVSGGWSLSDTVCVLKHVARHHIAEASK